MNYPTLDSNAGKAIWNVINKRMDRGASDESLIKWLEHLKIVWKAWPAMVSVLDGYIAGFKVKI